MKRLSLILAGVLTVQLAIAAGLTFSGADYSAFEAEEPLLAFDKGAVDRLTIDETGGSSVTLEKRNGQWLIPSLAGFPADQQAIGNFLDTLAGLKKGWPVGTTDQAAKRFKVAGNNYERRVVLKSGEKENGTLLIGTAPTYRQTHIRAAREDAVYTAALSESDVGARGDIWMDRAFLNIARDRVASITIGDIVLEQKDGNFTVAGLKDGEKLNPAGISPLVAAIIAPSFDTIKGKGDEALAKVEPADLTVMLKRKEGRPVTYRFKKEAAGGAYLFTSSEHPYLFRVAEGSVKPIAEASRNKLVQQQTVVKKPDPAKETAPVGIQ